MIALLDNTVLSNFTIIKRPDLLRQALVGDAATSEAAWAELQAGIHIGRLPQGDWSWLPILTLTEDESRIFQRLKQRLNAGEAACLAIAANRGYRVFTDDRDARELAAEWRIPISGTLGILIRLVDTRTLSLKEADALLDEMIVAGYRSPVLSLADLL